MMFSTYYAYNRYGGKGSGRDVVFVFGGVRAVHRCYVLFVYLFIFATCISCEFTSAASLVGCGMSS